MSYMWQYVISVIVVPNSGKYLQIIIQSKDEVHI
jgi:hypothetical protein